MKRIWVFFLAAVLLLTTACGKEKAVPEASFIGVIREMTKTTAVVEVSEEEEERASSDLISFGTADLKRIGVGVGDRVSVSYTGVIMESYPAQVVATGWFLVEKARDEPPVAVEGDPAEAGGQSTEPVEEPDVETVSVPRDEPPVLHVISGETEIQAMSGNYTWTSDVLPDGTQSSVIACGVHPLQMEPKEVLSVGEGSVIELHFDVLPDTLTVRCWEEQYWNDEASFEANYEVVTVENGCITPPSLLRYVYEVNADWGDGCSASYVFWAVTDAAPSAE